jgi:phosphate-selective porin OprO/OprP
MKRRVLIPGASVLAMAIALASTPALAEMTVNVGGRIQVDGTVYDDDNVDMGDGTEFRRVRLFAEGEIDDNWQYKTQLEFAGNGTELKDTYIRYTGWDFGKLTIGQFKQEQGLEVLTSSKYMTFIERAMISAFVPDRRIGLGLSGDAGTFHWAASVFGQEESSSEGKDEGTGANGRLAWTPTFGDDAFVHLGASYSWQEAEDQEDEWRVRARPETHQTSIRLVDTGTLNDVNNIQTAGFEGAAVFGPFSLQGEWMQQTIDRDGGNDPDLTGYYVYGSWFITGESRSYKGGKFGRTKATNAWEVAARYSNMDLKDGDINGGEIDNYTIGVNYYVNPYLRFMANYVISEASDSPANGGDDEEPDAFVVRAAMDFK